MIGGGRNLAAAQLWLGITAAYQSSNQRTWLQIGCKSITNGNQLLRSCGQGFGLPINEISISKSENAWGFSTLKKYKKSSTFAETMQDARCAGSVG
jgi:hypothetical protein